MFRTLLFVAFLIAGVSQASAGVPSIQPPLMKPTFTFFCVGGDHGNTVAISGSVTRTDLKPTFVSQDFVATVGAVAQLVVWTNGVMETNVNLSLSGALKDGMPTPGTAYQLAEVDDSLPFISSVEILKHVNGEESAFVQLIGESEPRTLPCQVLEFPTL